jgi:hypothetical protein
VSGTFAGKGDNNEKKSKLLLQNLFVWRQGKSDGNFGRKRWQQRKKK